MATRVIGSSNKMSVWVEEGVRLGSVVYTPQQAKHLVRDAMGRLSPHHRGEIKAYLMNPSEIPSQSARTAFRQAVLDLAGC